MKELDFKLKEKAEADMTMIEVIERVKNELTCKYEPQISKMKDESAAKDIFYQRELEKQQKLISMSQGQLEQRMHTVLDELQDFKNKLEDKTIECQNYIQKIDERRKLYDELVSRKEEMELNKNNIINDLEGLNSSKQREIEDMKNQLAIAKKDVFDAKRELENEKASSKEVMPCLLNSSLEIFESREVDRDHQRQVVKDRGREGQA